MAPTTFRTFLLRPVGTPSAAVRVVQSSATMYQRVVVLQNAVPPPRQPAAPNPAFISTNATELEIPGQVTPGEALEVPPVTPIVIVLAPGEHLDAVGPSVGTSRMSVAVSTEIPPPPAVFPPIRDPAFFRTIGINNLNGPTVRIVPAVDLPQRVNLTHSGPLWFGSAASDLGSGQVAPGEAFESRPAAGSFNTITFILAPRQPLFAANEVGAGLGRITVSAAKIDLPLLRGPTGIPGPDSQE